PDGSKVFVTGESDSGRVTGFDYATVAYDASTGAKLWVARFKRGRDARSVAVSPDGSNVFVTGGSDGIINGIDYATGAYDASTGVKLWAKRYDGPENGGAVDDTAELNARRLLV